MFKSLRWAMAALGAIGVLGALVIAGQGLYQQKQIVREALNVFLANDLVADILPPPMYLIEARLVLSQAVEGTLPAAQALKEFDAKVENYEKRERYWKENPPAGLEARRLNAQHEPAKKFIEFAHKEIFEPLQAGNLEQARSKLRQAHDIYNEHRDVINVTVADIQALSVSSMRSFESNQSMTAWVMAITAVLSVMVLLVVYQWVLKSIDVPVQTCTQVASHMASGDLQARISLVDDRPDSIGALQKALDTMRRDLGKIVGSVRTVAQSVSAASSEIAQGNFDLSSRTETQAGALQQTASAMQQLTEAVNRNAQSAQQANTMALQAAEVANKSGVAVGQVVETMRSINEASRQIAGIVSVIEGIAFQTNILALNAAVEAARAGEQGRGFAVVASEVRSLAGRSADAAKEIKHLIDGSVARVMEGSALADNAGSTMADMVGAIQRVTDIMAEISTASHQQSTGLTQVGQAVSQMDQTTQQNAALVEEIAATSNGLKMQATELVQIMSQFKVT